MSGLLFELQGIDHFYGAFQALGDVTVQVRHGAVGLLGPNGAGKTTLIKVLLGLLDPDKGGGRVLGHDIRTEATLIRQRIGYMPEHEAQFADMTGFEAVVYAARLCGLPRRQAIRRAHEVLDYAGIEEARYRPTEGYSTGMKQRVKLAQALVHGPDLVLLDEPTNGLDPKGRDDMLAIIDELRRIPVSVLLSSHLLPDVEKVCDDVLLLAGGRIRHYGPLQEFTAGRTGQFEVEVKQDGPALAAGLQRLGFPVEYDPENTDRFLVELDDARIDELWRASLDLGVQVRRFAPVQKSLERAFVQMVESP